MCFLLYDFLSMTIRGTSSVVYNVLKRFLDIVFLIRLQNLLQLYNCFVLGLVIGLKLEVTSC